MSLQSFYKVTGDIIDIYADEQTIIFENGVDNYELKFNVVSYSQEIIKFGYIQQDIIDTSKNIMNFFIILNKMQTL